VAAVRRAFPCATGTIQRCCYTEHNRNMFSCELKLILLKTIMGLVHRGAA
jgi:hypothetical protein